MKTSEMNQWLIKQIGFEAVDEPEAIEFYYIAMHDHGFGLYDTDDYAWLNTILRYNIGIENALAIINWFFDNYGTTVQDAIDVNDVNSKLELMAVSDELGLGINFSHWTKTSGYYEYGFKTDEFKEVE